MSAQLHHRIGQARAKLEEWDDGSGAQTWAFFVPGRIEVLGKHTDYAGGRSLIAATEQGLCVAARPRRDARVRMADLTRELEIELEIGPDLVPTAGQWVNYPETVARRLLDNFPPSLTGADVAFTSDLPRAAGMSSSSALVVALYLVLAKVNRLAERDGYRAEIACDEDLGGYLGAVENGLSFGSLTGDRGVGTFGGSEDQTAILCSEPGRLKQYSYFPVRLERTLAMPAGMCFAVGVSGVHASKAGGARDRYNRAARLASTAAEFWREATGGREANLAEVVALGGEGIERLRNVLAASRSAVFPAQDLLDRCEHFIVESAEILPAAGDALALGDLGTFGALVDRSQAQAERLLGNQIDETIHLARAARGLEAVAASAFGAGFGGSVWALIERADSTRFLREWSADYLARFPERAVAASFLTTGAAAPARELDVEGAGG